MASRHKSVAFRSDVAYAGYDLAKWPETKDSRYLGKCFACKTPRSALVPHTLMKYTYYYGAVGGPMDKSVSFGYELHTTGLNFLRGLTCAECGSDDVWLKPVKGTYNEDVACDPRCMNARGPNCECSCNGSNHGSAWG
jgi:hypothetical protein